MTDEQVHPEHTTTPQGNFAEGTSSLFQPIAQIGELAKEGTHAGSELLGEVATFGANVVQNVGEVMTEPGKLFQPTKALSTLTGFTQDVAQAGVETVKDLTTDTIGIATGAVGDMMSTGKEIVNIRTEPKAEGQLFQPKRPIEELGSIGSKVIKSGVTLVGGGVGTGVHIVKKALGMGTNIIKKGLGIFGRKKGDSTQ